MSSEQNLPEASVPQGPPPAQQQGDSYNSSIPHGMGQSKSSRRRRRKRKGKSDDFGPERETGPAQSGFLPGVQAQAAPLPFVQSSPPQAQSQLPQHFGNGAGQGKRWKKKFRDRERGRFSDNSGNQSFSNAGSSAPAPSLPRDTNTHQFGNRADSFKRKVSKPQRDRGPRGFVGPMDHSYRALNGGYETSPSTIDTSAGMGWSRGFYSGDAQPIDYSVGRSVPVAEDSPVRIYLFVEDLFFLAKINETTRKLGVKVAFLKNEKDAIADLLALEEENRPGLIVFDLNNTNAKPLTLIPKLKAKFKRSTSIIGFLSHLQGDLKAKATEAGCDTVMARSAFSQNLPNLLRRYGLEEEHEEGNFNR